jgi:prolyl 4-hydroxylase
MRFEQLTPELQQWIQETARSGHPVATIVEILVTTGYPAGIAEAVTEYCDGRLSAGHIVWSHRSTVVAQASGTRPTRDRDVHVLLTLDAPRVVLFGSLLSDDECDALIAESRQRLRPSTVVNAATGSHDLHAARTSHGASFKRGENELIRRIENRISDLLSTPYGRGEPIQVLNYGPGAEYKPHFDFFDPRDPGNSGCLEMGGQRFATLVMYLNDVDAGGSTVFPEIGLDVLPRKGNAIFFSYADPAGELDRRSLHGGSPVVAGEKWIATKWLRVGDYTGPDA